MARLFALLESGLNLLEQGMTIFGRDLRLIHANRRFPQLYDLPDRFLAPGTTFEEINRFLAEKGDFGPGDPEELVRERVERALAFEDHYMERTRPNGRVIAVEGHPLGDSGWVAVYTDITSQKRHEALLRERADQLSSSLLRRSEELAAANRELAAANRALEEIKRQLTESEARMRTITRSVPAHIAYVDRDRVYRFTNDRFADIFGQDSSDIVGRRVDELFGAEVMDALLPAVAEGLDGAANSVEYATTGGDGQVRHVRTSLVPDATAGGEVAGLYVLSLDISEQKRAMDMLISSKRLQAATQLTSGVVHDFSNILTIIQGNLNRLADDGLSAKERDRIIQVTRRAAERGGRVTDQLVSFSRNEELTPAPCNVNRVAADLVRLFSASLDPAIAIAVDEGEPLGAYVDERAFQDALLNLLLNARDAVGHAGSIRVGIARQLHDGAERVAVSVRDDGCGFADGTIEVACRAFFSTKQGGHGRGLGLSMVRRFVRRSGGDLRIESEPNHGALVTMLLPPAALEEPVAEAAGESAAAGFGGLALVIDDEPEIRGLVRQYLLAQGAKVIEAVSPEEALELVAQIPLVSLVVSDIAMTGSQTGLDMARQMRRSRPDLPILLISGLSTSHPALAEGRAEFALLRKPFGAAAFSAALAALLAGDAPRQGAPTS
ncbi:MAG: signal transduction histidine kinase [Alphaproteobacteria bacterium]|nr:MAG: signal transduction histidine kinase [Alphaproteobacteria bacterium]